MFSWASGEPALSAPLLVVGLILAFLGWILYWGGITALGAVLGAGFGSGAGSLVAQIAGWHGTGTLVSAIVGGVICAILGAFALRAFHALVFFLCGVVLGSLAVQQGLILAHQLQWTWTEGILAEILIRTLGALVGGVALVLLSKFIIVIVTSTLGTILIVAAWPTEILFIASVPIWGVSIISQYWIARRLNLFSRAERRKKEE